MTAITTDLARRAVACKGWRWMPGMRAVGRRRMPAAWFRVEEYTHMVGEWRDAVPDLTDAATLGALLALVREVAQEPSLHVRCMLPYAPDMGGKTPPPWVLHSGRGQRWGDRYETEAEALVAALEAAP
jgi:hypothetical protein